MMQVPFSGMVTAFTATEIWGEVTNWGIDLIVILGFCNFLVSSHLRSVPLLRK